MLLVSLLIYALSVRSPKLGIILYVVTLLNVHSILTRSSNSRHHAFGGLPADRSQKHTLLGKILAVVVRPEKQILHDYGIEATLFLRFIRTLRDTFGVAALVITPSLSCFNYFARHNDASWEILNQLTWSNVPPQDNRSYWLYVGYHVLLQCFVLNMISRELEMGSSLCQRWQETCRGENNSILAVQGVQEDLHTFMDAGILPEQWHRSLRSSDFLTRRELQNQVYMTRLRILVSALERRETTFLQALSRYPISTALTSTVVDARFEKRRPLLDVCCRSLPAKVGARFCSLRDLYGEILELSLKTMQTDVKSAQVALILSVDSYGVAEALSRMRIHPKLTQLRFHHVGDMTNLNTSSLDQSWREAQIFKAVINTIIVVMILVWSIPISASGSLSQLSGMLRLVGLTEPSPMVELSVSAIQGCLPQIATSILMALFPQALRISLGCCPSVNRLSNELNVQSYYFWFLYSELFVTTSIAAGLVPVLISTIKNGVHDLMIILAVNLPLASNYYLSYMLIQAFMTVGYTFARPVQYLKYIMRAKRDSSPRDQMRWQREMLSQIKWGELYPLYTCIATIGKFSDFTKLGSHEQQVWSILC